jgi:polar amino acid transport system substrate-binding protein
VRNRTLILLMVPALFACGIPRDSGGTLERVRGNVLRVGVSENPPWVVLGQRDPSGVEVTLVRDLARDLGAEVRWFQETEAELIDALHRQEVDLVTAGLTAPSPWSEKAAITKHYFTSELVVAIPRGMREPADLKGLEILVEEGSDAAGFIEDKGGVPRRVPSVAGADRPAAVDSWEVDILGLVPTSHVLEQRNHVVAAPPGENAFLVHVERFLRSKRSEVQGLLEAHSG